MAKTDAERAREYRSRKRDGVTEGSVTVHHENVTENTDSVTKPDSVTECDAQAHSSLDMIEARARRTDPDSLNWGEWMTADQLHEAGLKANRVSIPGDWDYVGVAV